MSELGGARDYCGAVDRPSTDVFAEGRRRAPRRWDVALVVAAGGAIGGSARFGLNVLAPRDGVGFPWATLLENCLGALLLGALVVVLVELRPSGRYARPFLGVGVLGGFTTFSTFTNEIHELLRLGRGPLALAYVAATLSVGLAASWVGLMGTRRVTGADRVRGADRGTGMDGR